MIYNFKMLLENNWAEVSSNSDVLNESNQDQRISVAEISKIEEVRALENSDAAQQMGDENIKEMDRIKNDAISKIEAFKDKTKEDMISDPDFIKAIQTIISLNTLGQGALLGNAYVRIDGNFQTLQSLWSVETWYDVIYKLQGQPNWDLLKSVFLKLLGKTEADYNQYISEKTSTVTEMTSLEGLTSIDDLDDKHFNWALGVFNAINPGTNDWKGSFGIIKNLLSNDDNKGFIAAKILMVKYLKENNATGDITIEDIKTWDLSTKNKIVEAFQQTQMDNWADSVKTSWWVDWKLWLNTFKLLKDLQEKTIQNNIAPNLLSNNERFNEIFIDLWVNLTMDKVVSQLWEWNDEQWVLNFKEGVVSEDWWVKYINLKINGENSRYAIDFQDGYNWMWIKTLSIPHEVRDPKDPSKTIIKYERIMRIWKFVWWKFEWQEFRKYDGDDSEISRRSIDDTSSAALKKFKWEYDDEWNYKGKWRFTIIENKVDEDWNIVKEKDTKRLSKEQLANLDSETINRFLDEAISAYKETEHKPSKIWRINLERVTLKILEDAGINGKFANISRDAERVSKGFLGLKHGFRSKFDKELRDGDKKKTTKDLCKKLWEWFDISGIDGFKEEERTQGDRLINRLLILKKFVNTKNTIDTNPRD